MGERNDGGWMLPFMKCLPYSPHVQIDVPSAVYTALNKGNGGEVQVARLLDYSGYQ